MVRSLMWKEWREQRPVALCGALLAMTMPVVMALGLTLTGNQERIGDLASLLPIANWALLWPLAAAATAASMLTGDRRDGSLTFLLSRPAPRALVWAVKVATAAAVTLLVIGLGQLVSNGLAAVLSARFPGETGNSGVSPDALGLGHFDATFTLGVVGFGSLTFAFGALLSLWLTSTLPIAAAATLGAIGVCAANLYLWWHVDYHPIVGWTTSVPPIALAAALLGATSWLFSRGEMLQGPTHQRRLAAVVAVALTVWTTGVAGAVAWEMRGPSGEIVIEDFATAPDFSFTAATIARADRAASRTVVLWTPDGEARPIGDRLSEAPSVSPDGTRIAWVSSAGRLGLRSSTRALVVHDLESGTERVLARHGGPFRYQRAPAFSPDARWVAGYLGPNLVIADTTGGEPATIVRRDGHPHCYLDGWTADSGALIHHCNGASRSVPGMLEWLSPATGTVLRSRQLGSGTEIDVEPRTGGTNPVVRALHVQRSSSGERGHGSNMSHHTLEILATGQALPLLGGAAMPWHSGPAGFLIDADPDAPIAYLWRSRIEGTSPQRYELQLRQLDPTSGADRLVDSWRGRSAFGSLGRSDGRLHVALYPVSPEAFPSGRSILAAYEWPSGTAIGEPIELDPSIAHHYYRTRVGGERLFYLGAPVSTAGDGPERVSDLYLSGWFHELRALDLRTGVDSSVFSGR